MTAKVEPRQFRVFVHPRKGRPRAIAEAVVDRIPATWNDDGRTVYFATADLVAGTLTYVEMRPESVAS